MHSYLALLLCLIGADLIRRVVQSLLMAYTGPLSKVPGPSWYKFSELPIIWLNIKGTQCRTSNWREGGLFKKYGPVVRIAPKELTIARYDGIQKILVDDDMIKAEIYELTRNHYPEGQFPNLHNERNRVFYRQKRRLLSPGFSITYINGLEPLMKDCVDAFVEVVDKRIEEAESKGERAIMDVVLVVSNLTIDVMTATSFGGSFDLVRTNSTDLRNLVTKTLFRTALHEFLPFLRYIPFTPSMQVKELKTMLDAIVEKRRREIGEGKEIKKDLLQIFVDANRSDPVTFSDAHITENMILFLDTASATTAFTLCLLLNNPHKLQVLVDELKFQFPTGKEEITFANTQELKYLNAVLNESMRVMPVAQGGFPRETEEDTIICGYEVPKGTLVFAAIGALLSDPTIWPDPDSFVPERWLHPYKGVEVNKKAYYPFSTGRHSCIGQQFALKELRLILATIVRRYEISLVKGQKQDISVRTTPYFTQGFYNVGFKIRKD